MHTHRSTPHQRARTNFALDRGLDRKREEELSRRELLRAYEEFGEGSYRARPIRYDNDE